MKEKKVAKKAAAKKPAAKKPRVGLDPKGIDKLEKIMLANGEYFYNQTVFGEIIEKEGHACGTELCAAGFSRLLSVGAETLATEVKLHTENFSEAFAMSCIADGIRLLKIRNPMRRTPKIFDYPYHWPQDLGAGFGELSEDNKMAQIRFYANMLRTRANSDGSLTEKGQKRY